MHRVLSSIFFLFSLPAFAVIPTIHCSEDERSVFFEEGIDDFLVDIRDFSAENTLIGAITKKNDRQKYLLQMRIPKLIGTEFSAGRPACVFAEDQPLLIACPSARFTEKLKLTNLGTGEVMELTGASVMVSTQLLKRESLDFQGKIQSESQVTFIFQMPLALPAVPPAPGSFNYVRAETVHRQANCKVGEGAESPAR